MEAEVVTRTLIFDGELGTDFSRTLSDLEVDELIRTLTLRLGRVEGIKLTFGLILARVLNSLRAGTWDTSWMSDFEPKLDLWYILKW